MWILKIVQTVLKIKQPQSALLNGSARKKKKMRKRGRQRELWKKEPARNRVIGYIQVEGKPSRRPVLARMDELDELSEQEVALLLSERYKLALAKHEAQTTQKLPTSKSDFEWAKKTFMEGKLWESDNNRKDVQQALDKFQQIVGNFELAGWESKINKRFVKHCIELDRAESTIHKNQRSVQACFNWIAREYPEVLPRKIEIEKISIEILKKQPDGEPQSWSKEQVACYFAEIEKGTSTDMRIFMLARYGIMRLSEIWSLPLSRIDLKRETIQIDHVKDYPKQGKKVKLKKKQKRKLDIHPKLLAFLRKDLLARFPEEVHYLDCETGEPSYQDKNSITARMRRFRNKAGLTGDPLHQLRRTGITEMLDAGMPLSKVSAMAGHQNEQTTLNNYVNRRALDGKDVIAAIG